MVLGCSLRRRYQHSLLAVVLRLLVRVQCCVVAVECFVRRIFVAHAYALLGLRVLCSSTLLHSLLLHSLTMQ